MKFGFIVVTCEALFLVHGQVVYSEQSDENGRYHLETNASFACNYGYILSGPNSAVCQISGTWDQTPHCIDGENRNYFFGFYSGK